jgi:hypothetical protein
VAVGRLGVGQLDDLVQRVLHDLKVAVEVLEYFDRVGLSRRDGNARHQVRPAAEVFGN